MTLARRGPSCALDDWHKWLEPTGAPSVLQRVRELDKPSCSPISAQAPSLIARNGRDRAQAASDSSLTVQVPPVDRLFVSASLENQNSRRTIRWTGSDPTKSRAAVQ